MTTATSNSITGITTFVSSTDVVNKEFVDSKLVAQAGNSGEFLTTTDGINVSWDYVSNYQEFTSTGTQTFTVPTNANLLYIEAVGGGGGGNAGITSSFSGAGGGSASYTSWYIPKNIISSSNITVTVGGGGSGASGSGSLGSAGNPTTISWTGPGGSYTITANPGSSGGVAGSAEDVTQSSFYYTTSGLTGGAAAAAAGNSGTSQTNQYQPPSGGSGGNTNNAGGTGGGIFYYGNTLTGGSGGTSLGTDGSSGSIVAGLPYGTAGGGGGAQSGSGLVTWTTRTAGTLVAPSSITYKQGGLYLASSSRNMSELVIWSLANWPTNSIPQATLRPLTLTYGNGEFICGTTYQTLLNSTNSIVWSIRTTGISFSSLCYGNGYMVGGSGTSVYVSTDNIIWTLRTAGNITSSWSGATYGNNRYVLVSSTSGAGRNIVSTDTINWQTGNYSNAVTFPYVIYGDLPQPTFVSFASGPVTSTNGLFWTLRTGLSNATAAAYSNGVYLQAFGNTDVTLVSTYSSTNAIVWTSSLNASIAMQVAGVTTPAGTDEVSISLGSGNGFFVLNGDSNAVGGGQAKLISTNGINWIIRDNRLNASGDAFTNENGTSEGHAVMRYGNGIFVTMLGDRAGTSRRRITYATEYPLFQYKGIGAQLTSSTDGISWAFRTSSTNISNIQSLSSNDNYYYALAGDRLNEIGHIIISTDSINWISRTSVIKKQATQDLVSGEFLPADIGGLAYGNGIYLAGVSNAVTWSLRTNGALYSLDVITYTSQEPPVSLYVPDTGQYMFFFQNGGSTLGGTITNDPSLVTSTDTIIWTTRTVPISSSFSANLSYGNNVYIISSTGRIFTSTDTVSWVIRTSGFGNTSISNFTYGNNLFVAVSTQNIHKTSTNGIVWITVTTPPASGLSGLGYGGGYYVVGTGDPLAVSTNYVVWTLRTSILVGGNYKYAAPWHVKAGLTIMSSTDTIVWTIRTLPYTSMNYAEAIQNNDDNPFLGGAIDGKYVVYNRSTGGFTSTMSLLISTNTIIWQIRTCPAHNEFYGTYQTMDMSNDKIIYAPQLPTADNTQTIYGIDTAYMFGDGNGVTLATSTDTISWTLRTTVASEFINSISYGNGKYLLSAVNVSKKPVLMHSTNAIVWNKVNQSIIGNSNVLSFEDRITSTYYANGYYFIGGSLSKIGVSTNAINWTARTVPLFDSGNQFVTNPLITSIAAYGNAYVIVGSSPSFGIGICNIATSTDTITWTLRTTNVNIQTLSIANDQQKFVIGGSGFSASEAFWLTGNGGTGARGAGGGGGGSNLVVSGSGGNGGDGYAKITWW
jgi:hypothetical protein